MSGRHAAGFACGGLANAWHHVGSLSPRLTIIIGENVHRMTFCVVLMPPQHKEGEIRARGERGESPKALPGAVASIKFAGPRGAAEQGVSGPTGLLCGGIMGRTQPSPKDKIHCANQQRQRRRHCPRIAMSEVSLSPRRRPTPRARARGVRGLGVGRPGERAPWPGVGEDPVRTFQGQGQALLPRGPALLTRLLPKPSEGESDSKDTVQAITPVTSHAALPAGHGLSQGHRDEAVLTGVGSVPSAPRAWRVPGLGTERGPAGAEALMEAPAGYGQGSCTGAARTRHWLSSGSLCPPQPAPSVPQGRGGPNTPWDAESECSRFLKPGRQLSRTTHSRTCSA